jgi:hypothetical protein
MISLSFLWRVESRYFPVTIESLIEYDLQKLQDENQEVVEDDSSGQWQGESSDEEEEGNEGSEGPPGSDYGSESDEEFANEDSDALILGVRIYTKGGSAVSVTGNVVGEVIIKEDEEEVEDKKEEDEDEDKDDKDKDKDSKKKSKKSKKGKGDKVPNALWLLRLDRTMHLAVKFWYYVH